MMISVALLETQHILNDVRIWNGINHEWLRQRRHCSWRRSLNRVPNQWQPAQSQSVYRPIPKKCTKSNSERIFTHDSALDDNMDTTLYRINSWFTEAWKNRRSFLAYKLRLTTSSTHYHRPAWEIVCLL